MGIALKKITLSGMFLAMCLLLPFLSGQIPEIGRALSPMHIPVLLCGFVCGWQYGLIIGLVAPIMRSLLFGMPPMFPSAVAMAFELAAYGLMTGLLYKFLPRKKHFIYVALVTSMLLGRAVWGIVMLVFTVTSNVNFTFDAFMAGAFTTALPGIIFHIALVPLIVMSLEKAWLIPLKEKKFSSEKL